MWTFITAPEDVSWTNSNSINKVDIFGTNITPATAGARKNRELTLSNALVEGFIRKVSVEGKIASLEELLEYKLNSSDGFVSVPVYQVWANNKSYGGASAYFVISNIRVKEAMRDIDGNATRAYVDISFIEVPEYQVNSGRDQASKVTSGGSVKELSSGSTGVAGQANQGVAGGTAAGAGAAGTGAAAKAANGTNVPKPAAPPAAIDPTIRRKFNPRPKTGG